MARTHDFELEPSHAIHCFRPISIERLHSANESDALAAIFNARDHVRL
jgi:hypothetical protein